MSSLIRASQIQADDLLDRLFKAWVGRKTESLSDSDKLILERMEYADAKLRKGGVGSRWKYLVKDMQEKFKDQDLHQRTIENDIERAKVFFGSVRSREDKEYARGKMIEWLERFIWKADKAGDLKSAAAFIRELNDIQGLKKDDPNLPDYESVQPPPIMIVNDPSKINVPDIPNLEEEIRILNMPKSSAMKFLSDDIEDAEELKDE